LGQFLWLNNAIVIKIQEVENCVDDFIRFLLVFDFILSNVPQLVQEGSIEADTHTLDFFCE